MESGLTLKPPAADRSLAHGHLVGIKTGSPIHEQRDLLSHRAHDHQGEDADGYAENCQERPELPAEYVSECPQLD